MILLAAALLTARIEVQPASVRVAAPMAAAARTVSGPTLLAPSLTAPALALAPAVAAIPVPTVSAAPAAPVMTSLSGWYTESSQRSAPQATELGRLWDGSSFKAAAAPAELISAVPETAPPSLPKAAPEQSDHFESVPGSIFDWKPVEKSPDHGLPVLDRAIRWALSREDGRFESGYEMKGGRGKAGVFFYGERHTDKALIRENMRRIAADMDAGKGALILDEGYFGPRLYGTAALEYLERKGFEEEWLGEGRWASSGLEVSGWDDREVYDRSKHPLLQHHMNLLDLNNYLYSDVRGLKYYRELARKAWETFKNWRVLRRLAITDRNAVLDRRVAEALAETEASGKSLHVIAGGEHLVQRPMLSGVTLIGRARMRSGLLEALAGRAYRAGMPPESGSD